MPDHYHILAWKNANDVLEAAEPLHSALESLSPQQEWDDDFNPGERHSWRDAALKAAQTIETLCQEDRFADLPGSGFPGTGDKLVDDLNERMLQVQFFASDLVDRIGLDRFDNLEYPIENDSTRIRILVKLLKKTIQTLEVVSPMVSVYLHDFARERLRQRASNAQGSEVEPSEPPEQSAIVPTTDSDAPQDEGAADGVTVAQLNGEKRSFGRGESRGKKKLSVNARMLETIQKDVASIGWFSSQWAKYLRCAKSSVVDTQAWKDLQMGRERRKAERANDRRRRPKGSELNRE
jgi:hypothetical protein